jgi:hypothetical protein
LLERALAIAAGKELAPVARADASFELVSAWLAARRST